MNYLIKNDNLSVTLSDSGAELRSILYKGIEYLWQGDAKFWSNRSPLLFPFIGRLTNGSYTLKGTLHHMDIHGFAKNSIFSLVAQTENQIHFRLADTPDTQKCFPFHFQFDVVYTVTKNSIIITYQVQNFSNETMYFGIGGHPGFQIPLEDGLDFEDYYLEFPLSHTPTRVGHTPFCFLSGKDNDYTLENGKRIRLCHALFDNDAIVLKNVADSVTLKSDKGHRSVTVSYPYMPYLGLWHTPGVAAPYLCIEPWTSLPSRQDIIEEFAYKNDLIRLAENTIYQNEWTITLN